MDSTQLLKELQEMREGGYLADPILRKAVKTIAAADDRYDWVGIYLMNDERNGLWLHNYVGEATEHAKIELGDGVCGAAAAEGENKNIPDVSEIDNYLPCSPDTQSELVVLIRAGDEVLGQIDLDSNKKGAFTEEDESTIQTVAEKLAEVIMAERR